MNDADRICYSTCPTSYGNPMSGKCEATCPSGMFGTNNLCEYCDFNCGTCTSAATTCDTCKYGWLGSTPGCTNPSGIFILKLFHLILIQIILINKRYRDYWK